MPKVYYVFRDNQGNIDREAGYAYYDAPPHLAALAAQGRAFELTEETGRLMLELERSEDEVFQNGEAILYKPRNADGDIVEGIKVARAVAAVYNAFLKEADQYLFE